METAIRLTNLVVLIINDSAYGDQVEASPEGLADFGLDCRDPDFVKYAESYGATGHRVVRTEDCAPP